MTKIERRYNRRIPFLRDYILIILLLIGLGFIDNNKPKIVLLSDLEKVEGVLFGFPVNSSSSGLNCIGLTLKGNDNLYQFVGNSYIVEKIPEYLNIKDGDSLFLTVKRKPYLNTRLADGSSFKSVQICEAFSPQHGYLVTLEEFNKVDISTGILKVSGYILIVISIIGLTYRLFIWYHVIRHLKKKKDRMKKTNVNK